MCEPLKLNYIQTFRGKKRFSIAVYLVISVSSLKRIVVKLCSFSDLDNRNENTYMLLNLIVNVTGPVFFTPSGIAFRPSRNHDNGRSWDPTHSTRCIFVM